ncbi:MAG: M48 family metalloprotease [Candidatus Nomurabacteria bacterium]|jgi:heat shock protein HtpX|nr:M48 family metalloprotease [Candidatus Nomurabacteria bacterium]
MYKAISANKRNTVIIMAVFLAIIGGLGFLASFLAGGDITPAIIIISVVLFYTIIQYFIAGRIAVAVNGGHEIQKKDAPELYRIVENLAITTGLPMPRVFIIQDPAPNAFATGRNPEHAMVAVTTGLLEIMDKRELEAVLAHEISHIKNYDIRVNMITFGLVSAIALIADFLLRASLFGGRGRNSDDDNSNAGVYLLLIGIAAYIIAVIVAPLIQLAVGRQREYLADASGALTTRDPEGLAMALEKLKTAGRPMQRQNSSTAHLFFANPMKAGFWSKLFSTHPPLDDRIARLMKNIDKM